LVEWDVGLTYLIQFYLPTIRTANETNPPTFELEYMTYNITAIDTSKDYPIPSRLLPPELRGGAETNLSEERLFARNKFAPYSLEDLTIPSWIKLGRKLGKGRKNNKKVSKLFKTFARYMYLGEIDV
jgi:endopolyphosphatase